MAGRHVRRHRSVSGTGLRGEMQRWSAEFARQVLYPVDEAGAQAIRLGGCADVGYPVQQLAQHHGDLPAGQVRAAAKVRSSATEAVVRVRRTGDDEPELERDNRLVACG